MVDEAIPYRELHHATLASLLQSAPEVSFCEVDTTLTMVQLIAFASELKLMVLAGIPVLTFLD